MEAVVPWTSLLNLIEPLCPKAGRGRLPYPLATMLRVHLMQNWFGLSDPAMEEALYEIGSMRAFAKLSLTEPIPDETTILNFRRLLETHELAGEIFTEPTTTAGEWGLIAGELLDLLAMRRSIVIGFMGVLLRHRRSEDPLFLGDNSV